MRFSHTLQHFFAILSHSTRLHSIFTTFFAFLVFIFPFVFFLVFVVFSAFCCHSAAIMAANHSIESCVYFSFIVNCRCRQRRRLPLPLRARTHTSAARFPLSTLNRIVTVVRSSHCHCQSECGCVGRGSTPQCTSVHFSSAPFSLVQCALQFFSIACICVCVCV